MNEMTLREKQIAAVNLLKEVNTVCDKLNITYWAGFGTLLGAIRHKGFIPWDDDIDICMKREDYTRFIEYCKKNLKKPYYIDDYENNKDYPFYISRFCDETYRVEFEHYRYKSGIFIDVYPFDGMGEDADESDYASQRITVEKIKKKLDLSISRHFFYGNSFLHMIGNIPLVIISKTTGRDYYIKKLEKIATLNKWDNCSYVGVPSWEPRFGRFKKIWFKNFRWVEFEDTHICIPCCYDEILKQSYGEYMKLPPESERVPHHDYKMFKRK